MLPALAPYYNRGFVIIPAEDSTDKPGVFVWQYYATMPGQTFMTDHSSLLFSLRGDPYNDEKIQRRKEFIGGLLRMKGISFHVAVYRERMSEVKRWDNQQKKKMATAKMNARYDRERTDILKTNSIFQKDLLEDLEQKLQETKKKLDKMYPT